LYRFDKTTPPARMKDVIFYYRDYAYEGEVTLGGKPYRAMLGDEPLRRLPWQGQHCRQASGVVLLLDVNGNGKFDSRGESFDIRKPFAVAGTTYEVTA